MPQPIIASTVPEFGAVARGCDMDNLNGYDATYWRNQDGIAAPTHWDSEPDDDLPE